MKPLVRQVFFWTLVIQVLTMNPAGADDIHVHLAEGMTTDRILSLFVLVTVLGLAPSVLMMMTAFTRIVIVLSFLRNAIGLQQAPPNMVLVSLALFLTFFVMSPVLQQSWEKGLSPLVAGTMPQGEAIARAGEPFHRFMMAQVREQDLKLFAELGKVETLATPADTPWRILLPAFLISELRRAFEIGFLLFVPFLLIDLLVSSVLMARGMMMLPPAMIALPVKLVCFVLVDGWTMLSHSLVRGFRGF
jgi:flagellar biosynthetic protein FliP